MSLLHSTARLFVALAAIVASSFAASLDVPASYLEQARVASARSFSDVVDVICQEHVNRYRISHKGALELIDSIDAQVAVEHGLEQYSAIRQNGIDRASLDDIGAVWSDGEYATFINDARQALNRSSPAQGTIASLNGTSAILISFEISKTASSWDFVVHGHHYQLGFHGEIWISQKTGELLRCRRIANGIDRASGVKSIGWAVDFGIVEVAGKTVSLPTSATYDVEYTRSDLSSHNAIAFTNYHRFATEASIRFE